MKMKIKAKSKEEIIDALTQIRKQYEAAAMSCDLTIGAIQDLGIVYELPAVGRKQKGKGKDKKAKDSYQCCGKTFATLHGLKMHRIRAKVHAGKK